MAREIALPDGSLWLLAHAIGYIDQVAVPFGGTLTGHLSHNQKVLITSILVVPPTADLVTATGLGNLEFRVDGNVVFSASVAAMMNRYRRVNSTSDLASLLLPCPIQIYPNIVYSVRHVGAATVPPVDETLAVALDILQEKGLTVDPSALRPHLRPPRLTVEIQAMAHGCSRSAFAWKNAI